MTNPIQVGMSILGAGNGLGLTLGATGSAGAPSATREMAGETFAALIENFGAGMPQTTGAGKAGTAPIILANIVPATGTPASPDETALGDMLSQLLEKLTSLAQSLEGDTAPDVDALDEIADLLAGVQQLLEKIELPVTGSAGFEKIDSLAARLGLTLEDGSGPAANPYDALAALATKVASVAKDAAPELSTNLGAFASLLNGQVVAMETAAAQNADPSPDARKVVLLNEVQATPASDIKAARAAGQSMTADTPENDADHKPAETETSKRALAKPDAETRPDTANRPPQSTAQAKAAAQAAVSQLSGDAQASNDAPDTFIVPNGQQNASQAALGARPAQAAMPSSQPATPINMQYVAAEITRHVQNGINRFEIRLNPPELGRIDVRMEMDQSGNVVARLAVERSETLDLMQRDQRALERALADAGLDAAKTELEFSLRQDGGDDGEDTPEDAPWRAGLAASGEETANQTTPNAQTQLYRGYARADAVNIWA